MGRTSALIFLIVVGCKLDCTNLDIPVKREILVLPVRVEMSHCDKEEILIQKLKTDVEYWRDLYFANNSYNCLNYD
jgi:hypothetical protein